MPPAAYTHRKRALPLKLSRPAPRLYRLCMLMMRCMGLPCMKQQVANRHTSPLCMMPSPVCMHILLLGQCRGQGLRQYYICACGQVSMFSSLCTRRQMMKQPQRNAFSMHASSIKFQLSDACRMAPSSTSQVFFDIEIELQSASNNCL